MGQKLYLIGIDAAPLWFLEKFKSRKHMEVFKMLIDGKHLTELESTLPPMTGAAWPTIYTGLNPSQHGVPDFFVMKKDYTPDLVYYDSSQTPPFWEKLANSGYRCLIITPATDIKLPEYRNVDIITGFPLKARTNNKFLDQLMKKYGFNGEPDIEKDMKEGKISVDEASKQYVKSINVRAKIAKEAMEANEYDFVYVCFTETDRLQHFVLNKKNYAELLIPLYAEIGKYIEYVIKRTDNEKSRVMLVSDHGSQPIKEKFLINTWMANEGYVKIKDSVLESIIQSEPKGQTTYTLREKLMKSRLRKAYDKLPHGAKGIVSKSMGKLLAGAGKGGYTRLHLFDFDMSQTRAFAAISNLDVATIWINDDRFANGFVSKKEKVRLKKEIANKLTNILDPKGNKLIVKTIDADKYYGRTKKFIPADLFAEAEPGYSIDIFHFSKDSIFMEPELPKSGDHTRMGIFGVYPERAKERHTLMDIAPIILSYFKVTK